MRRSATKRKSPTKKLRHTIRVTSPVYLDMTSQRQLHNKIASYIPQRYSPIFRTPSDHKGINVIFNCTAKEYILLKNKLGKQVRLSMS